MSLLLIFIAFLLVLISTHSEILSITFASFFIVISPLANFKLENCFVALLTAEATVICCFLLFFSGVLAFSAGNASPWDLLLILLELLSIHPSSFSCQKLDLLVQPDFEVLDEGFLQLTDAWISIYMQIAHFIHVQEETSLLSDIQQELVVH